MKKGKPIKNRILFDYQTPTYKKLREWSDMSFDSDGCEKFCKFNLRTAVVTIKVYSRVRNHTDTYKRRLFNRPGCFVFKFEGVTYKVV